MGGVLDAVPPSFAADAVCGHWVTAYQFHHAGVAQHHADIACITGSGHWVTATNHPPAPRSGDRAAPFCNRIEAQILNRHLTRKLGPGWARGSEPWPERWQGWRMALVVPAGGGQGNGVGGARGGAGKGLVVRRRVLRRPLAGRW
jgi:hypothetical protein